MKKSKIKKTSVGGSQQWNAVFQRDGAFFVEPQEDMPKIVKAFKRNKVEKVLDLGCGSGRHTVYLAKHGFSVYGLDIAPEGLKLTRQSLRKGNVTARLKLGSIYERLPYRNKFFDAILSTQTLHHAGIEDIRRTIKEMERVLKPGGRIFVTVQRIVLKKHSDAIFIAPRTYIPTSGDEKDLPHYLFDKRSIRKEFSNFTISKIWFNSDRRHCCFMGRLKASAPRGHR